MPSSSRDLVECRAEPSGALRRPVSPRRIYRRGQSAPRRLSGAVYSGDEGSAERADPEMTVRGGARSEATPPPATISRSPPGGGATRCAVGSGGATHSAVELLLSLLAAPAVLALEHAHELLRLALHAVQVVVGELTPPRPRLATRLLPPSGEHVAIHVLSLLLRGVQRGPVGAVRLAVVVAVLHAWAGGRRLRASGLVVARGVVQLRLVHRDRVLLALGHRSELQIRPRNHDLLLANAGQTADADDDVSDPAAAVDQQLVDFAEILARRALDARADDVLRLVQAGLLPGRRLRITGVAYRLVRGTRGLRGGDQWCGEDKCRESGDYLLHRKVLRS